MRIGLDFDGVISDCGQLKSMGAARLYGVTIPPEKFKKEIVLGEKWLTPEQYRELQSNIYGTPELGLLMDPVPGMIEYLPLLISDGHQVTIITSRANTELSIARTWSVRQGLALTFIGVGYGNSKAEAARGLDVFVDDDLDKLVPLVPVVPHRFLFEWGYNQHVLVGQTARRIKSWAELYRWVSHWGA